MTELQVQVRDDRKQDRRTVGGTTSKSKFHRHFAK